jgi:hypothetical protein
MSDFLNSVQQKIKKNLTVIIVFLFSLAVIQGSAFTIMNSYKEFSTPDSGTYLGLANGDFNQSPYRKYRVIVPFMASGIDRVFGGLFEKLRPYTFESDFSISVSFWIVNTFFMAIFSVVVFLLCRSYGISIEASLLGLLTVITCRWTSYLAGLPLVDSLYCLILVLMLLGLKTKDTRLIILCIFLGPWAKESFIFVAPIIFFFAPIHKLKQIGWFALSGILVFSFRLYFDHYIGVNAMESIKEDLETFYSVTYSLNRFFSFHGVYEIFSIVGLWAVIPLLHMLLNRSSFFSLVKNMDLYMYIYLISVFVQAIISSDLARMFYMSLPVFAVFAGSSADFIFLRWNKELKGQK